MPKSLTGSIVGIQQTFVSSLPLRPTRASIFKKVRTRLSEGLTGNVVMGNRKGLKWWAAESPLTHLGAVSKPAALVPEGPPSPHPPPTFPRSRDHLPLAQGETGRPPSDPGSRWCPARAPLPSQAVFQTLHFMARYSQGSAFLDTVNLPSSSRRSNCHKCIKLTAEKVLASFSVPFPPRKHSYRSRLGCPDGL